MIEYLYKCMKCKRVIPINKNLDDCSREERCPFCSLPMNRVYTPPIVMGLPNLPKDQGGTK